MNFLDLDPDKVFPQEQEMIDEREMVDEKRIQQGARLNNLAKSGGLDEIIKVFESIEMSAWQKVKTAPVSEMSQLAEMTQYARVVSEVIKNFRNEINRAITAARESSRTTT